MPEDNSDACGCGASTRYRKAILSDLAARMPVDPKLPKTPGEKPDGKEPDETEETEETINIDTTEEIICTAHIDGPVCTCVNGLYTYSVISPNCPGGTCWGWKIHGSGVARIQKITDCTITVLVLREGTFALECDYFVGEWEIQCLLDVQAFSTDHVLGDTTTVVVATVPLVQPHPFVSIEQPRATREGQSLPTSAFRVHERKLDQGFQLFAAGAIDSQTFARDYLEVEVCLAGTLSDFFREITHVRWTVDDGSETELNRDEEFSDTTFATQVPGEDNLNPRVIVLRGLGEFTIKVVAENPIARKGSDWITLFIALSERAARKIARLQKHLAELLTAGAASPRGANARAVQNTQQAIHRAYREGLQNPTIECWHNHQTRPRHTLEPRSQTRTQGKDAERSVQSRQATVTVRSTSGDDGRQTMVKRVGRSNIMVTDRPVKNFWVTHGNYRGKVFGWESDGMLRGDRGSVLSSLFACCEKTADVFGVEYRGQTCFTVKRGEAVSLLAEGLPAQAAGAIGKYRWSVVAKPDPDARTELDPDQWTSSPAATLKVDTSGIYTVKVEYELAGRSSPLTYALADITVNVSVAEQAAWQIRRSGAYVGAVAAHVDRPYYQERTNSDTRAAEIFIQPKGATSRRSASGPEKAFGRRFSGSLVIPKELAFVPDLTVRAYFKPYRPDLTKKDFRDFTGLPHVQINPLKPFEAEVDIHCRREIHAVHLINVQYRNLMRLKGQAVPIHFVFQPPKALRYPHHASPEAPPVTAAPPELLPLINLLVYNRDLGAAHASQGFQPLSCVGDAHNLPNGNLFLAIPLFTTNGHGENLELSLIYNSLQASYQDSLDLLRRYNGLSLEDIHRDYCANPLGHGWTHSYNLRLYEYVRPRDETGKVLDRYLELSCPDGNCLHFVMDRAAAAGSPAADGSAAASGSSGTGGVYRQCYPSDHWTGSAEWGHSLQLSAHATAGGGVEYVLEDRFGGKWKFDNDRRLVEITSRRIEQASLPAGPVDGTFHSLRFLRDPMSHATTLKYDHGRLEQIRAPAGQTWQFQYLKDLGQPNTGTPGAFLTQLTDPTSVDTRYEYYDGEEFYGVGPSEATDFWGRLGRVTRGAGADMREHLWRYRKYQSQVQQVVYRNPGRVEFFTDFRYPEMAVVEDNYVVQDKDPGTGALTGLPNYDAVLSDPTTHLPRRRLRRTAYYRGTKLAEELTDYLGNQVRFTYVAAASARTYLLDTERRPDGTQVRYEYYPTDLVKRIYNPVGPGQSGLPLFTEYAYDTAYNVTRVTYPELASTGDGIQSESWSFDPAMARLAIHTDRDGVQRRYGYDDPARDPEHTGLATTMSVDLRRGGGQARTLTWETTYDRMGRATKTYDPTCGEVREFTYDDLGWLDRVLLQPIPVSGGRMQGAEVRYLRDGLQALTSSRCNGRGETWAFNSHGEVTAHTDAAGWMTAFAYHGTGAVKTQRMPDGSETRHVVDELNRVVRINHPRPDGRTGPDASEVFTDVFEYDDGRGVVVEKRYQIDQTGAPVSAGRLRRTIRRTYASGRLASVAEAHEPGQTTETRLEYDEWGEIRTLSVSDGGVLRRKLRTERDEWGRAIAHVEEMSSASRRSEVRLDANGQVREIQPPRIHAAPQSVPRTTIRYDELGRQLELRDSYGTVVKSWVYRDFGNSADAATMAGRVSAVTEFGQDPAQPAGRGQLIVLSETHFNRRGDAVLTYLGPDRATAWQRRYEYDAASRVVAETDENGVRREFVRDGLGRPTLVTVVRREKKPGIEWEHWDSRRRGHTESRLSALHYEYGYDGQVTRIQQGSGAEQYTRDACGRVSEWVRQDSGRESLTYDVFGRTTRKRLPDGTVCAFTYDDRAREETGSYINPDAEVKTRSTYDWDGKIQEFRYLQNRGPQIGDYNRFYLRYEYSDLGKLRKKTYHRKDDGAVLGSIGYTYNAADLRTATEIIVNRPGIGAFRRLEQYEYDANFRMTRLDAGPAGRFRFLYNDGGYLKKLSRPLSTWTGQEATNSTTFAHDQHGRLLSIVEMADADSRNQLLSQLDLHYGQRPRATWEPASPWDLATKTLLPATAPALWGLVLRRHFAEDASGRFPLDEMTQDLAYAGAGSVHAAVTRWHARWQDRLVDLRATEINAGLTVCNSITGIPAS